MKKIGLLGLFFSTLSIPGISAQENTVYLGGESVGIVMEGGVEVTKLYSVNGELPWLNSGLSEGSFIKELNGVEVSTVKEARDIILNANTNISVTHYTEGKLLSGKLAPYKIGNSKSIGVDMRDKMEGVGTLTYVKENMEYGALGHIIKTARSTGKITGSNVVSVTKSTSGRPGYKNAALNTTNYGSIIRNDFTGIYGSLGNLDVLSRQTKIKVGNRESIKPGNAQIYTVLSGNKVEKFNIEITNLYNQSSKEVKSMKIKVTDQRLINETGGIVQGMSGSPIVQNNRIVGAVTHVIVDSPLEGYGIYIDWMLK